MGTFLQLLIRGLETGAIYALTSLGIILIFRTNDTVNFAIGSVGMFCTYVATYLASGLGLPIVVSAVGGVVAALALGVVMDVLIIRHVAKVGIVGKQIITLGVLMIMLGITPIIFGINLLSLPRFISAGSIDFGSVSISANGILNIVIGLLITFVLFITIQRTKLGLAIRATASGEGTARMLGIPTKYVTMFAWACAGALSSLSGVMTAPGTTVSTSVMDVVLTNAFLACFLGGYQTFYGPVIASFIIGILRNMIVYYWSSVWGELILYVAVFIFIIFRPNGLIGKSAVKKV